MFNRYVNNEQSSISSAVFFRYENMLTTNTTIIIIIINTLRIYKLYHSACNPSCNKNTKQMPVIIYCHGPYQNFIEIKKVEKTRDEFSSQSWIIMYVDVNNFFEWSMYGITFNPFEL